MTATWIETKSSRSATIHRKGLRADSTFTRTYKVLGASDDIQVHNEANSRFSEGSIYQIGDYSLMVEKYEISQVENSVWEVTAQFVKTGADADTPSPLGRTRSFDTTGATTKVTQSVDNDEVRYSAFSPSPAPDMKGAINADGDNVQGVDIIIPSLQWSEKYDIPSTYVTANYIKTVAQLTGCVNEIAFRTFAPGEVLFMGASGSQEWDTEKGNGPWSLTFKFAASPNAGNGQTYPPLNIGDIEGIAKDGHDFLWVRYKKAKKEKVIINEPEHVYVNKVYRRASFAYLGIGS